MMMMTEKPSGSQPQLGAMVPHFERFTSLVTGELILIECECPIGEDHTYADWVARFTRAGL